MLIFGTSERKKLVASVGDRECTDSVHPPSLSLSPGTGVRLLLSLPRWVSLRDLHIMSYKLIRRLLRQVQTLVSVSMATLRPNFVAPSESHTLHQHMPSYRGYRSSLEWTTIY